MACSSKPELEITQNGNDMVIKLSSMVKTKLETFTVGTDFEEKQHNGLMYKISSEWSDGKLVLNYNPIDDDTAVKPKITRELTEDGLVTTMEANGITAKRHFQKKSSAV